MTRVATAALGSIEAAAMAFVRVGAMRRAPFVSLVARARFRIVPGEVMRPMPPAPLVATPIHAADGRLVEPGDHALYLPRAELMVLCAAPVPTPRPARVMVSRGGTKLFSKSFVLDGFASLGPMLRTAPPQPDGPLLELAEGFDFGLHQAAPADQLLDFFLGGDSVVLDQIARQPRWQTWLPAAAPSARLYSLGGGPTTAPFALAMDRLVLDLDSLTATLLMRACVPLASEVELRRVCAVAAFDAASAEWPPRFEAAVAPPALDPGATMTLEPEVLAQELARSAAPFVPSPGAAHPPPARGVAPALPPRLDGGTLSLEDVRLADLLAAQPPAPFSGGATIATEDLRLSDVLETLPFRPGSPALAPSPPREPQTTSLAGSTLAVEMSLADVLGRSALPFESRAPSLDPLPPLAIPPPPPPLPPPPVVFSPRPSPIPAPEPGPPSPVVMAPASPAGVVDEAPAAPPPAPERRLSPSEKLAARAAARKREKQG